MFSKPRMNGILSAALAASFSNPTPAPAADGQKRPRVEDETARNKRIRGRKKAKVARKQRRRNKKKD